MTYGILRSLSLPHLDVDFKDSYRLYGKFYDHATNSSGAVYEAHKLENMIKTMGKDPLDVEGSYGLENLSDFFQDYFSRQYPCSLVVEKRISQNLPQVLQDNYTLHEVYVKKDF